MEKRLVITRADDDVVDYTSITHPVIKEYTKRCGAQFEILKDSGKLHKHYRILQIYDKFEEYDKILVVDSDILIRRDCPNLFEEVDDNCIGTIFEDVGSRKADRRDRITRANTYFGDIGWTEGYPNTGVALFTKEHKDLFKYDPDKDKLWMDNGYDDVFLGYRIYRDKIPTYLLDYKFNFMSMFAEQWCGIRKSQAYIIHYAGMGHHPNIPKPIQINNDYLIMQKYGMI